MLASNLVRFPRYIFYCGKQRWLRFWTRLGDRWLGWQWFGFKTCSRDQTQKARVILNKILVLIWLKLYRLASKSGFRKLPLIHSWVFYVNNNYLIRWIERGRWPSRHVFYLSYFISITEFVLSVYFERYRAYPIVLNVCYFAMYNVYYYHNILLSPSGTKHGDLKLLPFKVFSDDYVRKHYDYTSIYNLKQVCINLNCSIQPFKYIFK